MNESAPRVTIRVTRNRLHLVLWVALAAATWVRLAGEISVADRSVPVTSTVSVWQDSTGVRYILTTPYTVQR